MALMKEDWFKIGKDLAFAQAQVIPETKPREGSWQRQAWERGWKAGSNARQQARIPARVIGLKVISVRGPLYPPRTKHKTKKREALLTFLMSTQSHPDGPITVSQLLQGQ